MTASSETYVIELYGGMNLARLHPAKDSVRGKLKDAAWNDDFREQLLFGIND